MKLCFVLTLNPIIIPSIYKVKSRVDMQYDDVNIIVRTEQRQQVLTRRISIHQLTVGGAN
jgi:hypothetical protein